MPFFRKTLTDSELIDGILTGGQQQRYYENYLYDQYLYLIRDAVRKHQLDDEDASIVYSDTILTSIENIQRGRFEGRSTIKTYIHQIFSNKCVDVIRKKTTKHSLDYQRVSLQDLLMPIPDNKRSILVDIIKQQDYSQLNNFIKRLGERCQEILKQWSEGFTDEEIAKEYQYTSAGVAQTTRLRCLEKLREFYKAK
ncbi:RNA polymerase sigma-70 factor (ECF subfamily) [Arcicella aurantiaca]|uniref:RNA polymerase sigma-70 factor (ECF subfamily) n=1 Tax=Arcicella aurantiaca TaxID=591202 RepID=A0A316EE50_9BACT|nr:sigma-70 family RNA polymerase sigma factor [Arcicella aurantiaca]PWK27912.1 RNA polymerase sigma-70 factor (ECF subfamily) [Arcicella aurantiaca]